LAALIGAAISFEAAPGKESCFVVELPSHEHSQASTHPT
jgi:hypothetical protein